MKNHAALCLLLGFIVSLFVMLLPNSVLAQDEPFFANTPFSKDSVVRQKCSVCHKLNEQNKVEVIEETRKTPEEWQAVISRMRRINGAPITEEDFHQCIKELSQHLMLTPDEMSEVAYINTLGVQGLNSQFREVPQGETEERIFTACVRCHTYGKIRSHKKTAHQWEENMVMHLGYYPTVVPQMREMDWPKEAMELVDILAERDAFDTPEWREWMKNRSQQDLSGTWIIAGYQPGMGYYHGSYTIKPNPEEGEDEYFIEKSIQYANGMNINTSGQGTLFGEYHLRYTLAPTALFGKIKGVFDLEAAQKTFQGTWWTAIQDNNAYGKERFVKKDNQSKLFANYPGSLQSNDQASHLTLIGTNIPQNLTPQDISFTSEDVQVLDVQVTGSTILCKIEASSQAAIQTTDITINGMSGTRSINLYDQINKIQIYPRLGRARVSCGAAYPPEGVQFVARGIHFGKDGQLDTEDDVLLEPVDAKWSLEEEVTRENDDDLEYLKAPVVNGLYTPVTTYAPIQSRDQNREGVGLIAITANYSPENGVLLKDRALLAVTETDFIPQIK